MPFYSSVHLSGRRTHQQAKLPGLKWGYRPLANHPDILRRHTVHDASGRFRTLPGLTAHSVPEQVIHVTYQRLPWNGVS